MTSLADNARAYLAGITAGDLEAATRGFADHAVLEFPYSALPVSKAEGVAAIRQVMAPVAAFMSRRDFKDIVVTETGSPDLVILDFESDFDMADGRGAYRNRYHCVVHGHEGRIVRWREFYDPRIAAAAVGNEAMNTAVVLEYATNFQKGDSRSLVERVFTPDIEYLVNLPREQASETIDAIPWAGMWRGHEEVLHFEEIFGANWWVDEIMPSTIIAKDDEVVVFGRMVLTAKATKKVADTPLMIRFTLRDRKIAKYHLMEDTYGVVLSHRSGGHFEVDNNGSRRLEPRERSGL